MAIKTLDERLHYIDHLRGFMFIFMAIDHSLHAYANHWRHFWFFRDYQGNKIFDALYLHDQVIIMPMLFFIFGMFVLPSLQHRGFIGYWKERLLRLGPIYLFGVPFIVPILAYPKYKVYTEPGIGYWEYWWEIFLGERLQAGPFWVLHAIIGYTVVLICLYYALPSVHRGLTRAFRWCVDRPMAGYICFGLMSSFILGVSDILWGAPWWTNFGFIFSLQSSRMLLIMLYFLCGSALMQSGLFQDEKKMNALANQWPTFLFLYIPLAGTFMLYSVGYHDEAFNEDIHTLARTHGGWIEAWPLISVIFWDAAPGVLIRTTLFGFLCMTQALLLISLFKRFFRQPTPWFTSLARNGFGIFIIHESIVVWTQYSLLNIDLPLFVKFLITAIFGISLAWVISAKILLKVSFLERIFSPRPGGI